MNHVKAYLFWIVCGVALVIEIVLFFVLVPTAPDGSSAEDVKQTLDTKYTELLRLKARADNKSPTGLLDAENDQDIQKLLKDYLLTELWDGVLKQQVEKYQAYLHNIKSDLVQRSDTLRLKISDKNDNLGWYTEYQHQSEQLLIKLRDGGQLALSEKADPATLDLKDDKGLRDLAGFYTKPGDFPRPEEFPLLTARFRIMEMIIGRVVAAKGAVVQNSVAAPLNKPRDNVVMLAGVKWAENQVVPTPQPPYASHALTVSLVGPEALVSAALAEIESIERPVLAVVGSSLHPLARTAFKPGDLNRQGFVPPVALDIEIRVLDFPPAFAIPPAPPAAPAVHAGQGAGK